MLLVHVGGLAATVQAEHVGQPAVTPLEIVHLAILDECETAAPTTGHVVARHLRRVGGSGTRLTSAHGARSEHATISDVHVRLAI